MDSTYYCCSVSPYTTVPFFRTTRTRSPQRRTQQREAAKMKGNEESRHKKGVQTRRSETETIVVSNSEGSGSAANRVSTIRLDIETTLRTPPIPGYITETLREVSKRAGCYRHMVGLFSNDVFTRRIERGGRPPPMQGENVFGHDTRSGCILCRIGRSIGVPLHY